jgi:hypothetical protein
MRFRLEPASKRAHEISKNYESLRGMYAGRTYQKSHRVFAFQVISCRRLVCMTPGHLLSPARSLQRASLLKASHVRDMTSVRGLWQLVRIGNNLSAWKYTSATGGRLAARASPAARIQRPRNEGWARGIRRRLVSLCQTYRRGRRPGILVLPR